jgi:hypothetical protein
MISLIGNKENIGGRDSHTIHVKLLAQELNSYRWPKEDLTIKFTTTYPGAWETYLNDQLNTSTANLDWQVDRNASDYYIYTTDAGNGFYTVSLSLNRVNSFDCTLAIVRMKLS